MRDLFQEIFSSLQQNKLRTALTGFAVAWGIFMLIALLGAGNGVLNALMSNSGTMDHSMVVYSQYTSKAWGGYEKNRRIRLSWKKLSGLDSYEVQMAKTKNGKYTRIGRTKKIPFTTKAYRSGQRLYFRVRGVKQVDGRAVYTGWSKKLTVRVK